MCGYILAAPSSSVTPPRQRKHMQAVPLAAVWAKEVLAKKHWTFFVSEGGYLSKAIRLEALASKLKTCQKLGAETCSNFWLFQMLPLSKLSAITRWLRSLCPNPICRPGQVQFLGDKRGGCLFQLCFKHSSLQQMAHQNSLKASESKSSGNSFTNKKNTAIYGSSSGPCMAPAKGGQKWLSVRECSTSEGSLNSEQIH